MAVLLREVKETLGEVRLLRKEDERELEELLEVLEVCRCRLTCCVTIMLLNFLGSLCERVSLSVQKTCESESIRLSMRSVRLEFLRLEGLWSSSVWLGSADWLLEFCALVSSSGCCCCCWDCSI